MADPEKEPKEDPKWKRFERLVEEIQKSLAPDATVTLNDKVRGKSGALRQIDVSVRQQVGQFNMFIAFDCKDYAEPADVKCVEEFIGMLADIDANKAVMVCSSGFSSTALERARQAGIHLYRPVHTGEHDWKALVTIPAACDFRCLRSAALEFTGTGFIKLPAQDPKTLDVFRADGSRQGTTWELVGKAWNDLDAPPAAGKMTVTVGERPTFIKTDGVSYRINISAEIDVEQRLYFHEVELAEIAGFHDEHSGELIAREFRTKHIIFEDVDKSWQRIGALSDLAVQPFFTIGAQAMVDLID